MKPNILQKKNIVRAVVIIGIIIIPLMYSFFYLSAFWDPYSRLESLPVAVVNNDIDAAINGTDRNLGKELCSRLQEDSSLKFVFTNEDDARKGTEGKDYYAMMVIPEDFSADVASASKTDKHMATITFSPNEKKNYLAGQILSRAVLEMEKATRENVTQELVQSLADQIDGVPSKLTELQDGFTQLQDGSEKLLDGTNTLKTGAGEFFAKFNEYAKGVSSAKTGAGQLESGAAALSEGAGKLNSGISSYTAGVDKMIAGTQETSAFIASYVKAHPELMSDPTFAAFLKKMSAPENQQSIAALSAAGAQLKAASQQITVGAQGVSQGTSGLNSGLTTLNIATAQLDTAAGKLASGADSLYDGTEKLSNGISDAKDGVDRSVESATSQLSALDGLSDFASQSVEFKSDIINPIANYGTYFSPYFMSLSLWVGALIIFFGIYLDADGRFAILSRNSTSKIARSFIYLLIGCAQAIVLGIVITAGLGLDVKHMGLYFLSVCLVSAVFIAIVQFCMVHLGDVGKFISIALLILQLTSCGGTFPMETVPKFFNVLYPFMPMTYSVALFKDTISGKITGDFWFNFLVLCCILVIFVAATILLSIFKKEKTKKLTEIPA